MPRHRSHRFPALLGLLLIAAWPAFARAETAFTVKGGAVRLQDDTQYFGGALRGLDDTSHNTFALGWEHRRRHGVAFGMEYLSYRNEFTPPSPPGTGLAKTQVLQFIVRKYFEQAPVVHPFVGFGIGTSQTTVTYDTPTLYSKYDWNPALQLNGGIEFRIDQNFAASIEVKGLFYDVDSNHYNPSATGVFLGMSVVF